MKVPVDLPSGGKVVLDDGPLHAWRAELAGRPEAPPVRAAFAAVHVVMTADYAAVPHAPERPGPPGEVARYLDLDATMALRRRLDGLGLGIAEAMDTAQRFSLGWEGARRLIVACGALRPRHGFVAGAGTDQLSDVRSKEDAVAAVVEQAELIASCGGVPVVLPIPWLARSGAREDDYVAVYGEIARRFDGPMLVHWLGKAFAPDLAGYFPGRSFERVMALDPLRFKGCKLSLLDAPFEVRTRRALLERDQLVFTGDDHAFPELVLGGDGVRGAPVQRVTALGRRDVPLGDFSHALLGILDGVAEPAALALCHLALGDVDAWRRIMEPCARLSRWIFRPPTERYKCGLAFLAWLNGLQDVFQLVNHEERLRPLDHYVRVAELAGPAGAVADAALAAGRLRALLAGAP